MLNARILFPCLGTSDRITDFQILKLVGPSRNPHPFLSTFLQVALVSLLFTTTLPIAVLSQYLFGITLFLLSTFLVLLILIQQGRGGGLTGALGGPGGQSAFGTKAGDIFTRVTIVVASIWIVLSACAVYYFNEPNAGAALSNAPVNSTSNVSSMGVSPSADPGQTAPAMTPGANATSPAVTPAAPLETPAEVDLNSETPLTFEQPSSPAAPSASTPAEPSTEAPASESQTPDQSATENNASDAAPAETQSK